MKAQLIKVGTQNKETRLTWYCPGCRCNHGVPVPPHPRAWTWNNSLESPTIAPSVLITYNGPDAGLNGKHPAVCHCFVVEGKIQFLHDCTHDHAGNTVEMGSIE